MAWAVRLGFIFFHKTILGVSTYHFFYGIFFLYIFYPIARNDRRAKLRMDRSTGGKRDLNFIVISY